uniref:Nudix hydrolase 16 like 1 n=1 Tax=Podarcis muralis TaxID=64176 RepID=A0A670JEV2_PODMU
MPTASSPLRPLRRAEGLRLGPGWSHALLHAPHPGMLFARISLRYAVLVRGCSDGVSCLAGGWTRWPLCGQLGNRVLGLGDVCLTEQMVAHLYAKQLTLLELHAVEISAVHSRDHRLEVGLRGSTAAKRADGSSVERLLRRAAGHSWPRILEGTKG